MAWLFLLFSVFSTPAMAWYFPHSSVCFLFFEALIGTPYVGFLIKTSKSRSALRFAQSFSLFFLFFLFPVLFRTSYVFLCGLSCHTPYFSFPRHCSGVVLATRPMACSQLSYTHPTHSALPPLSPQSAASSSTHQPTAPACLLEPGCFL